MISEMSVPTFRNNPVQLQEADMTSSNPDEQCGADLLEGGYDPKHAERLYRARVRDAIHRAEVAEAAAALMAEQRDAALVALRDLVLDDLDEAEKQMGREIRSGEMSRAWERASKLVDSVP